MYIRQPRGGIEVEGETMCYSCDTPVIGPAVTWVDNLCGDSMIRVYCYPCGFKKIAVELDKDPYPWKSHQRHAEELGDAIFNIVKDSDAFSSIREDAFDRAYEDERDSAYDQAYEDTKSELKGNPEIEQEVRDYLEDCYRDEVYRKLERDLYESVSEKVLHHMLKLSRKKKREEVERIVSSEVDTMFEDIRLKHSRIIMESLRANLREEVHYEFMALAKDDPFKIVSNEIVCLLRDAVIAKLRGDKQQVVVGENTSRFRR